MQMIAVLALLAMLVVPSLAVAAGPELRTDDQKTLYALGIALSQNLTLFNLSPAELELVKAGLADGALRKEPQVDMKVYGTKIQEMYAARATAAAAVEKKTGQAFVDKASHEKGATKLPSGVIMTTLKPGTGASPTATDKVKVHYHGTLIDGQVFDSSVQRNEPATLPLNGVIKCWSEALPQMKVGGKSRIVCPPELAYGDRGAPPRIRPGATLVFDIELLDIVK